MAKANKLIPVVNSTVGTPIELTDSRIEITNPAANDLLQYDSTQQQFVNTPASSVVPSHRTINHEQITDSSLGDANLHDGFYFPNAVQDYDGNWYGAVVIGDQVWLAQNLRTKHLADGTEINNGAQSSTNLNYHDYATNTLPVEKRGLLYSYPVVNSGAGLILSGWKSPSSNDFDTLKNYIEKQNRYSLVAKSLAATDGWETSNTENAVGNNLSLNNASGLSLYPSGSYGSNGETNTNNCILWATKNSNVKTCLNINHNSTQYGTLEYNYSSWMLAIRLISTRTPVQFRDWYVKTYGTLQHKLDELPSMSGNSGKVLAVNSGETGAEWVTQSGGGNIPYGVCNSALYTVAMTAQADGFVLEDGASVMIRFTNGIRWEGNVQPMFTLNINSTGAKYIEIWGNTSLMYSSQAFVGPDHTAHIIYQSTEDRYFIMSTDMMPARLQNLILYKQNKLPSYTNNAGKVLAVNSGATDVEWVEPSGGGDAGVLSCTLTPSGSTYTCDTSVSDIVTAYQSGKVVLLKITTDYRVFICVHARTLSGTTTINAFYTGGVTASNSGMTDASITLLRYVGSEWQLLNSWNIQEKLVSGITIKTINSESLLGTGNINLTGVEETLISSSVTSSTFNITYGSVSGRAIRMIIQNGLSSVNITLNHKFRRVPYRIIIDNSNNVNDVSLTFNLRYENAALDEEIIDPALKTTGGYVLKAGDSMEMEHIDWALNGQEIGLLGLVFGTDKFANAVTIYSNSTIPSPSLGSDGDIYIQTVS